MPNSLRNKIKHFCYKDYLSESERDRLLNALDDADRINSELNRVKTELDCISREDAIEVIAGADETNGNEPVFSGKQIIKMLKDLPPVTPKARWIPVSERLPEIHQDILLSLRNLDIEVGFRAETEPYFYCHGDYIEPQNVLAWMPLPQPYKECDKE